MHSSHDLELFPGRRVAQMLFKSVQNSAELRRRAMEGNIPAALINPRMVFQLLDPFQVIVAANKAVHLQMIGKMKTRSLNSEIIFNLSPTNNISDSFKRFGISDTDDCVLVVLVATDDESQMLAAITEKVDGKQVALEELPTLSDLPQIRKLYKVTPQEEENGALLEALVCKMAAKDVL